MSQLWGPALDAEIAYRQEKARESWTIGAGHWADAARAVADVADRIGHAAGRAAGRAGRAAGRVVHGTARRHEVCKETALRRAEEIAQGIEGMRPRQEHGHRFA